MDLYERVSTRPSRARASREVDFSNLQGLHELIKFHNRLKSFLAMLLLVKKDKGFGFWIVKIRALQVGQVDLSAPTKSNVRLLVKVRLEQVYYLSKTTPSP